MTAYVKKNYARIEQAKRMTLKGQQIHKPLKMWLEALARQICQAQVETKNLTVLEKLTVIFLVNYLFHEYRLAKAEEIKNFLLHTIALYHERQVTFPLREMLPRSVAVYGVAIYLGTWS